MRYLIENLKAPMLQIWDSPLRKLLVCLTVYIFVVYSLNPHTTAINAQNCCVVGFVIIENKTSVLSVAVYSQRISCPGRQVVIAVCDTLKCEDANYFWT